MSENAEIFIRLYEELLTEVNKRAARPNSHSFEIEVAATRDQAVRNQQSLLKYIRDVRHTLQHPQHKTPGHAIEISSAFVSEIGTLIRRFKNPPTATSVGVGRDDIRLAKEEEKIGDLALLMRGNGFSHLPILSGDGAVIGVFNEAAVFDHLWTDDEVIIGRTTSVSDIMENCRLDREHTETFQFVRPTTGLDELAKIFSALSSPTTRVGAVFVTAAGTPNEPLQRLITPWDVLTMARD